MTTPAVTVTTTSTVVTVRQPRGAIKINGIEIDGWVEWEAEANSFYAPDTFRLTLAISALHAPADVAYFDAQGELDVEVFAGLPLDPNRYTAADLESVFYGRADTAEWNWDDLTLVLEGRDLTGALADTKSSEKYINRTASEVAKLLAGEHGLTPVVTATTTRIGKYVERDHVDLQSDRTEWDLLTWLAQQESFVVYVQGHELHFEPAPSGTGSPYVVQWTPARDGAPPAANAVRIRTVRELTLAKDIEVTVRSWNAKAKVAYIRKATRSKKGSGRVQRYTYTIPGLSPEQAQARANQIAEDLSRQERRVEISGSAHNDLTVTRPIQLTGTGTSFDQLYYPDRISRRLTFDGGYEWEVTAKNHSPESTVAP